MNWQDYILKAKDRAEEMNISQAEIAVQTGYSKSTIKRIFDLDFCPKFEIVLAIFDVLGLTLVIYQPRRRSKGDWLCTCGTEMSEEENDSYHDSGQIIKCKNCNKIQWARD